MIAYRIGNDAVSAVGDCKQKLFKEVWLDDRKVAQQMRPQSEALRRVLAKACKRRHPLAVDGSIERSLYGTRL